MDRQLTCNVCGSTIPLDSSSGECPHCLFALLTAGDDADGDARTIGDYQVEEEIARGGMGVVYRAHQLSLNRTVALKMVAAGELASAEALQRFRIEAQAAGNLHHPNIVPIYEVGEEDGQPFFSMRLVEGRNLADRLPGYVVPAGSSTGTSAVNECQRRIATLLAKVARAVAYAHQHGVLHRDLKPTNILVDQHGDPQLTDFGLAKLIDAEGAGLTLSTSTLGSPGYIAPEQAQGDATTASDIYGIGAVLYELLTGRPPFAAESAMATIRQAIEQPPRRPQSINPAVAADLETVCLKCLEKQPAARYTSAGDLADDLERFARGEPVAARPVSPVGHLARWCRRKPGIAALAASLLVALFAGIAGVTWQWQRAETSRADLTETVRHLEWGQVRNLIDRDDAPRAIAELARVLRDDPDNWKAAMYAMSIVDQHRFPLPVGKPVQHPGNEQLLDLSWDRDGHRLAAHTGGPAAWVWDLATGESTHTIDHSKPVTALALSPDGTTLHLGDAGGQLVTHDLSKHPPAATTTQLGAPIAALRFDPSGDHLFLSHPDRVVRYHPASASALATYPTPGGKVSHLALDGSGANLAIAGGQNLAVFASGSPTPLASFDAGAKITSLQLDPTGAHVAVVAGRKIKRWSTAGGPALDLETPDAQLGYRDLAISADGHQIAGASNIGNVVLWDTLSGQRYQQNMAHIFRINAVDFAPHDNILFTASADSTARLWNIPEGRPESEFFKHADEVRWGALLGADDRVLTGSAWLGSSYRYHLWNVSPRVTPATFATDFSGQLHAVGMSPDGRWVGVASPGRKLGVYDTTTGALAFPILDLLATAILFTTDSDKLIIVTAEGDIQVRQLPGGELLQDPIVTKLRTAPARLNPDGTRLAIGSHRGKIQVWDTAAWTLVSSCQHQPGQLVSSIEFSPDGTRLLTTSNDATAKIWDIATGDLLTDYTGHTKKVMHAAFTPDGQHVVTGAYDFTAHYWDAATGQRTLPEFHHRNQLTHVAASPDGRRIATASRDGIAQVWDTATGEPVCPPLHEDAALREVRFNTDGSLLFTLTFTGTRIWDTETGEPLTTSIRHKPLDSVGYIGASSTVFDARRGRYLLATNAFEASLHTIEIPSAPVPAWLSPFLEAIAMQRIDDTGAARSIPFAEAAETRERLIPHATDTPYARWARRLSTAKK